MTLLWCKKCLLPNTRPNLIIENNGNCSACNNFTNKKKLIGKKENKNSSGLLKKLNIKN